MVFVFALPVKRRALPATIFRFGLERKVYSELVITESVPRIIEKGLKEILLPFRAPAQRADRNSMMVNPRQRCALPVRPDGDRAGDASHATAASFA